MFGEIATYQALHAAAHKAVKGKRSKAGAAAFMARLEPECFKLEDELQQEHYRSGKYLEILVRDPKRRIVSAAPFRDRVVHHALFSVICLIFERGFIPDSYANGVGKGTHRAVSRYENYRDRYQFVLRADIWRYFPSIDHAILKAELRRRIACPQTLSLCEAIIDGSNPQEPVNLYFVGDDLVTPFQRARGLPLGNLSSQFFANVYLDGLDHFAKEILRTPYLRYVDDFALFSNDKAQLQAWREKNELWLQGRRLQLHPLKPHIAPCTEPATFLGFELRVGGLRRLPAATVTRFRNRFTELRKSWRAGNVEATQVQQRVGGWVAHAKHAHTAGLRSVLLKGGWFDPYWHCGARVYSV